MLAGYVLLIYLFLLLPWSAWRSAHRFRAAIAPEQGGPPAKALPSPARIYAVALLSMWLLLYLTWMAARESNIDLFHVGHFGTREWVLCAALFVISSLAGSAGWYIRSPTERRSMLVRKFVPRTKSDWILFVLVAVAAGVAEESAYRGVATTLLASMAGSVAIAAVLSAVAFALAHQVQGWKSVAIVFVKGLLMQGLVIATGTLIGAMVVHALLDITTAWRGHAALARG